MKVKKKQSKILKIIFIQDKVKLSNSLKINMFHLLFFELRKLIHN